jgi:Uncharacterized conserved protein (DUF2075)
MPIPDSARMPKPEESAASRRSRCVASRRFCDTRSNFYLEDAATEFQFRGLEFDWVCVTWDADLRFTGDRWCNINSLDNRTYLRNAYHVLLTRARQGMVVFVPPGDRQDPTRLPAFHDPTFDYLRGLGIPTNDSDDPERVPPFLPPGNPSKVRERKRHQRLAAISGSGRTDHTNSHRYARPRAAALTYCIDVVYPEDLKLQAPAGQTL